MRPLVLEPTKWPVRAETEFGSHHARHALSRRAFIGSMASVAGAAMGVGLVPTAVLAAKPSSSAPKPTPNTVFDTFHVTFFGPGIDPSSIGDFNGFVGVADVRGTGNCDQLRRHHGNVVVRDRHALHERRLRRRRWPGARGHPRLRLPGSLPRSVRLHQLLHPGTR